MRCRFRGLAWLAAASLAALSDVVAAQGPACSADVLLRIEKGSYADATKELTKTDLDGWARRIRELCAADLRDWPNPCADGEVLEALGGVSVCSTAGAGSVTSVNATVPAWLAVSGVPITGSGTIAITAQSQAPNLVLASPTSGGAAGPAFRALVAADIPALNYLASSTNYAASSSPGGAASAVATDSVTLTTHTAGPYVASLACGAGLTGCPASGEGATGTLAASLGASVAVSELDSGTAGALLGWDALGVPAALSPGASGRVLTANGAGAVPTWELPAGGSGDVTGPASSTANQIPVFSSTTGKALTNSTATVSGGFLRAPAGLQVDATVYITGDGSTTKTAIQPTGAGIVNASNMGVWWTMSASALDTLRAGFTIVADDILRLDNGSGGGAWMLSAGRAFKGSDESVASSATLQDDDALSVTLIAGRRYSCEARLHVSAGTLGGIKIALGGTASLTNLAAEITIIANTTGAIASAARVSALGSSVEAVGDTTYFARIEAGVEVTTGGTLLVSWAQQASNETATTVLRGSTMRCEDFN